MKNRLSTILTFAFLLVGASLAQADQIVVFSTVAAKAAMEAIAPDFERESKHKVTLRFATAGELKTEIEKGAAFDVALLTAAADDDLIKQSKLAESSRVTVFKSGVGIAVKKGAAPAAITTSEALKTALVDAKSIALSTQGASGPIMKKIFERFGIVEAMAAKTVLVSGITAPEAVARDQAELAFTQISEILDTPGAQLVSPLPADVQVFSTFVAAIAAESKAGDAARGFLQALATPAARAQMKARGLEIE